MGITGSPRTHTNTTVKEDNGDGAYTAPHGRSSKPLLACGMIATEKRTRMNRLDSVAPFFFWKATDFSLETAERSFIMTSLLCTTTISIMNQVNGVR